MNLADVDLRLLRVFRTIVECEGLAAAEAKLNIGRSTISTHLSELESRLGFTLCKRGRSGFELTEIGSTTYAAALELFAHCETFVTSVNQPKKGLRGQFKIAVFDGCLNDPNIRLHQAIDAMKAQSSAVHFDITACPPDEVEVAVLNGQAKLGITTKRTASQALAYTPLFDEVSHLYCSANHPLAQVKHDKLKPMVQEVDYVRRGYRRGPSPFSNFEPKYSTAVAHSEEAVTHLILSGRYIGFLPQHFAESLAETERLIRLPLPEISFSTNVGAIVAISEVKNHLHATFIRMLQE